MARGFTIWLTGLSAAGKTTIAERLEQAFLARGRRVEVLDGDVIRTNLSQGLGFSKEDRDTNIRRIGFVCDLLSRNGAVAIAAAISPYRAVRDEVRQQIGDFVEVYVRCSLDELIRRDPKGLYAKALRGEIAQFTGVSDPYEPPVSPEVEVDTEHETVEACVEKILAAAAARGYLAHESSSAPARPHGGALAERLLPPAERASAADRARRLPAIPLNERQMADLELLAVGAISPLRGFMNRADYESVVERLRLADGTVWPIPVTLTVDRTADPGALPGDEVALTYEGQPLAILRVSDLFRVDRGREARLVYGTESTTHPGVAAVLAQGDTALGGEVDVFALPPRPFARHRLTPRETRAAFVERGWRSVVAFQTRNPVHRAHEYLQKCALESVDGMLLHPLVGQTRDEDISAETRMRCYETLLERYYPADRTMLAVFPAAMRYAGPREAVFHALVRKNYGCTHIIIGRDHAGVGSFYGTYDAQRLFDAFTPDELGIAPLTFENTFFCRDCGSMASSRTCPHDGESRLALSGTAVRDMLRNGVRPPPEFTRPEVADILIRDAQAASVAAHAAR